MNPSINLYRSATSVGEHEYQPPPPPLPKRAETFSGFDGKERDKSKCRRNRRFRGEMVKLYIVSYKAKGFNYQAFVYIARSFCLKADDA